VIEEPDNNKGVWVAGNARTNSSFSATVKLLTAIKDVGGACVYGSNYPPVGKYTATDKIEFTGTPGYDLVFVSDATTHTESNSYTVPNGYTVQSFIDKTGAPGKLECIPSSTYTLVASATAYCAGSTVTFALSNTTSGRTYRLYKDGVAVMNALTTTGGAATFTGTFAGAGIYTAQVIAEGGNCAATMTGTRTVSENPVPKITLVSGSGDASQTVNQGTAITDIVYSTTYSAVITGSGFPSGVDGAQSGTPTGTSYTISGTPTAISTVGYLLTATVAASSCTSTTAGTITVRSVCSGSTFCTSSTWNIGNYTWSDRVVAKPSNCTNTNSLSTATSPPAQYKINNESGVDRYYYNWSCARTVCPSGWTVPTKAHYDALVSATNYTTLNNIWCYGGYAYGSELRVASSIAYYWSSTAYVSGSTSWRLASREGLLETGSTYQYHGLQVRCVK
jgi:hypothetical protein